MPDITISITDAQVKVLRRMDATATAKAVLQTHVDTWLAPDVLKMETEDFDAVRAAYRTADATVRTAVKGLLGLG